MSGVGIPLVEVSSPDARERGRQYGEQARERIERSIEFYAASFERTAGMPWNEACRLVTGWNGAIEAYLPEILDEVAGIAEGAARRPEEILALNARGEFGAGDPFAAAADGCTSFVLLPEATGDGHTYAGQNWDWRERTADTLVVLRLEQDGKPTIVMQTEAGQVGRHGASSAGIALNANGLGGWTHPTAGVPQPYIRRKVLEAAGFDEALAAVFESSQAICTNLLLTHRAGFAIDLETTPARHGWLYPRDGLLVHANHFAGSVPRELEATYRPFAPDSLYRAPRAEGVLRGAREAASSEEVRAVARAAMSDHFGFPSAVCCHPDERRDALDRYLTVASSLVDLTTGEYRLATGPPCANEYELLPWNLYDGPPGKVAPSPELLKEA